MLIIRIENNDTTFRVPRGLLCAKSAYFESAFRRETFKEGREHCIELSSDVAEWVLEVCSSAHIRDVGHDEQHPVSQHCSKNVANRIQCFIGWLYTQRIFWQPLPHEPKQCRYEVEAVHRDDEDDPSIPVTWPWEVIIQLYVFGDRYDTKGFRNAIMDVALLKALQIEPRSYLWPDVKDQELAYKRLPSSSKFYWLLLDIGVHEIEPTASFSATQSPAEALGLHLPAEALAILYCLSSRLAFKLACPACQAGRHCGRDHASMPLRATFRTDFTSYYEHDSDEEVHACLRKWTELAYKHKLDMVSYEV